MSKISKNGIQMVFFFEKCRGHNCYHQKAAHEILQRLLPVDQRLTREFVLLRVSQLLNYRRNRVLTVSVNLPRFHPTFH